MARERSCRDAKASEHQLVQAFSRSRCGPKTRQLPGAKPEGTGQAVLVRGRTSRENKGEVRAGGGKKGAQAFSW